MGDVTYTLDYLEAEPIIKMGVFYNGPTGNISSHLRQRDESRVKATTPAEARSICEAAIKAVVPKKHRRDAWYLLGRLAKGYSFLNPETDMQSALVAEIARQNRG
jgi:hypothetical protein